MKPLIKLKTTTLLVIPLVLACFALLPRAQAATPELLPAPAPDGAYTGFNTAEGLNALFNVNTAVGQFNTALGFAALKLDTTGAHNTGVGGQALLNNNGSFNTAVGENALVHNTTGGMNMALGQGALANNKTGSSNTAMGFQALQNNTVDNNTAVGFQAMQGNTSGPENVGLGFRALASNTVTGFSVAVGFQALDAATGGQNTAVGDNALGGVTSGFQNTAIGDVAGFNVSTANNVITIGAFEGGQNVTGSTYIGNIAESNYFSIFETTVFIDTNTHRLHVNFSSQRFKDEIKPMDKASEAILALKPVTFHYKNDAPGTPRSYGLVAEDVAKVNPDLVVPDRDGKPLAVHYESINVMLLNEFLKEHKKVEEQQASIADLKSTVALQQKEMQVLTAQLKEQAAQIQKVSAQVETIKPAPKVVANQ
jgi:hypothetical protein